MPTHLLDAPSRLDPGGSRRFRRLVTDGDFDVVHAHSPAPAAQARVAVRALPALDRPAFVYTEHNRWPSHDPITRRANAATFGLNDASIAVSAEVRELDGRPVPASAPRSSSTASTSTPCGPRAPSATRSAPSSASRPTRCWPSPSPTSGRRRATRTCWPPPAWSIDRSTQPVRFVDRRPGPARGRAAPTPRRARPRARRADPRLSGRRRAHHRRGRPVRAGLAPRGAARSRSWRPGRRRARGGHRRGGPARGRRPRRSGLLVRPADPICWPPPSPTLAADPDRARPARRGPPASGRRGLLGRALRARDRGRLPRAARLRRSRAARQVDQRAGTPTAVTPGGHVGRRPPRPAPTTASAPIERPGVTTAPVPRNTPGADGDRAVDQHARAEGGVVAHRAVVGDDRVDVDLHVVVRRARWW